MTAVEVTDGPPLCKALRISDDKPCTVPAIETSNGNLFCKFHAKQCYGLYLGYKRRTNEFMSLSERKPPFLRDAKASSLNTMSFEPIQTQEELAEVHEFLFNQFVLVGKAIRARELHHKHFYSQDMDYGHKAFLDKLVSTRHSIQKALENLEKRTAELLYEKEKWYNWVRDAQDDEEKNREKEQKKRLKQEHALFQRHKRELEARLAAARAKEEERSQAAYLENIWTERMAASASEDSEDSSWDPIEDVVENTRGRYLDLIRHFLWIELPAVEKKEEQTSGNPSPVAACGVDGGADGGADALEKGGEMTVAERKKARKRAKKKSSKMSAQSQDAGSSTATGVSRPQPDKSKIESKEDVRNRLKEGVEKDYSHINGPMLVGTAQNPAELEKRTAPVKDEDIDKLIADITEIKELLFCRQVMSRSTLLPAALKAGSVEEFLADPSISDSDLLDLCIQVEQPSLQALRDACADFVRGDEPDNDDHDNDDEEDKYTSVAEYIRHHYRYGALEDLYLDALSSISRKALGGSDKLLEDIAEDEKPRDKKMKVQICGRSIWNHASQHSMARNGWLHFSIMAKDCEFPKAISLCRNWDEFFELNCLALWQYFPASKWTGWSGNFLIEELTQLGFVPFFMDLTAHQETTYNQLGTINRKVLRKQSLVVEARNFICAHMKRNDPVSRRFIQYALMRPGEHFILVRDGKTGRIVVAPEDYNRWIVRSRSGVGVRPGESYGRHGNDGWDLELEVDAMFFELAGMQCQWRFSFSEYYEVYIWDFAPGMSAGKIYKYIKECLSKAHRIRGNRDKYKHMKPIMETLTREPDTMRVRQIKPGENVKSLYDELAGPDAQFYVRTNQGKMIRTSEDIPPGCSPYEYYNDTDAAEDAILFEEEELAGVQNMPFVEITNPVQQLESTHMPLSILNHKAKQLMGEMPDALEEILGISRKKLEEKKGNMPYAPGSEEFPFEAPPIWQQQHDIITETSLTSPRAKLLTSLDFASIKLKISMAELEETACAQEIMERDRSYIFKDTFHIGDLEPGAQERYKESMKLIIGLQKYQSPHPRRHQEWTWFCMEILNWLNLKIYYDVYVRDPAHPWPHRYILQDIVQAFMTVGLFFPNLEVTSVIQEYLGSAEGAAFKNSKIFDPEARRQVRPDVRTRTSCAYRPRKFWNEWENKVYTGDDLYIDAMPWDWNMAIRPIIAKLYRAGMIEPACVEPHPEVVPGFATANTEEHRPGKFDLFITYSNTDEFVQGMPPSFIDYRDWPELLPAARKFAAGCKTKTPRFALLRLWSAPHFYPLMMLPPMRQTVAFLDPVGRAWEWKFIPKDMPMSEWSVHNTTMLRLGFLREQVMGLGPGFRTPVDKSRGRTWAETKYSAKDKFSHGHSELDDKTLNRGDLILVMGDDEKDLLKWCTAVSFAMQTKPWLREVDLWKSFINVDLEFLETLDSHWLE